MTTPATTGPRIKCASIDDAQKIATLFDAYRVFYGAQSDPGAATAFVRERLLQRDSVIFWACQNSEALGFTQLYPSFSSVSMQRLWILNDLYVVEHARGQRIGERLIERAMHHARETNAKGVQLETAHSNVSGQRLYERLGFAREDLEFRTYFLAI